MPNEWCYFVSNAIRVYIQVSIVVQSSHFESTWNTPAASLLPHPSLGTQGFFQYKEWQFVFISLWVAHDWDLLTPTLSFMGLPISVDEQEHKWREKGCGGSGARWWGFRQRRWQWGSEEVNYFWSPPLIGCVECDSEEKTGHSLSSLTKILSDPSEALSYFGIRGICDCFSIVCLLDCELQKGSGWQKA